VTAGVCARAKAGTKSAASANRRERGRKTCIKERAGRADYEERKRPAQELMEILSVTDWQLPFEPPLLCVETLKFLFWNSF
jgi:hypothetical protein